MSKNDTIGPYKVTGLVGRGGMGTVLHGVAPDGGVVALKTLRGPAVERLRDSMRREVAVLETLRHPHIVRLLDADIDSDAPWYAMELIDGRPFSAYLSTERAERLDTLVEASTYAPDDEPGSPPLPADLRLKLRWVAQVAHALAYLHGEGVVHGDLKPSNIVASGRRAVLVDFGLAARLERRLTTDALRRATSAGHTPAYTAPERYLRRALDPRVDIYALGCILFELLTGRRPFEGDAEEVRDGHLHRAPPTLTSLGVTAPPTLEALTRRLLAKDPADRPGSALEVCHVLSIAGADWPDESDELPTPAPRLYDTELVGRGPERRRLDDALVETRRGHGSAHLLKGGPGSGKSSLAAHVIRRARTLDIDVVVATSAVPPYARAPLAGCKGLLDALLEVLPRVKEVGGDLPKFARHVAAFDERFRPFADGPLSAGDTPQLAVRAVTLLTERFCCTQPTLFVCDDMHRTDQATREVVAELVRLTQSYPWLVLSAARDDEADRSVPEQNLHDLQPLNRAESSAAVQSLLGQPAIDDSVVELVRERTSGNPFHIRELLQTAADEGVLSRAPDGSWIGSAGRALRDALELVQEPASLQALGRRRVERLPDDLRYIASVAALIGADASAPLLSLVTGEPTTVIYAALEKLERRGFLMHSDDPNAVRFARDWTREALYGSLDDAPRLHSVVADALEARRDSAERVAWHREHAGERDAASRGWETAARVASSRGDHGRAADRFGDARRTAEGARDKEMLAHRLAALVEAGRFHQVLEEIPQEAGSDGFAVDILCAQSAALRRLGRLEPALEAADQAVARCPADDTHRLATARLTRGDTLASLRPDDAALTFTQALREAESIDDAALIARTRNAIALLRYGVSDYEGALDQWTHALAALRRSGDIGRQIDVHMNIGNCFTDQGHFEDALLWLTRARDAATELGDPYRLAWVNMNIGVIFARRNEYAKAREAYLAALRHHRRSGEVAPLVNCLVNLGADDVELGNFDRARDTLQEAIDAATGGAYLRGSTYGRITLFECELQAGEYRRAERLIARAEQDAVALADPYLQFSARWRHVWLAVETGRDVEPTVLDTIDQLSAELGSPSTRAEAHFVRGLWEPDAKSGIHALAEACRDFDEQKRPWFAATAAGYAGSRASGDAATRWRDHARSILAQLPELGPQSLPRRLASAT